VEGLKLIVLLEETATPDRVPVTGVNTNGWVAFVEAATMFIFEEVTAVPTAKPN
jgi:hypothetical protein